MAEPTDYIEIVQLLALYTHIVDSKAWDRLGEIFADDGSMTVESIHPTHRGDAELRVLYGEKMQHPMAHHSTSVVVLESTAGTARVISKWIVIRGDGVSGAGVYSDELVRTAAGWRIQDRVATPYRRKA
jgi:hypothetical protein